MKARTLAASGTFATLVALASLAGCGGGSKPADSPENATGGDAPKGDESSSATSKGSSSDDSSSSASSSGGAPSSGGGAAAGGDTSGSSAAGKTPYDKDAVEIELKRAVRQVKANCGAATDDSGAATGPWGKLTATITLGRNGHIRQVTIPPEYDGKPVGICIVHAFQKILFPPYPASADATVDYALEVTKPKK